MFEDTVNRARFIFNGNDFLVPAEIGANLELGTTALTKLLDGLIKTGVIILNGYDAFNTTHFKD